MAYPANWHLNSGPLDPPPPEGTLLETRGAKIMIAIRIRPAEEEMPKILRDQGWLESTLSVDGVAALAYGPPETPAHGTVRKVVFSRDGLWYDMTLTIDGRRYLANSLRVFDAVMASWKWADRPSDTGTNTAPIGEPKETQSLVLSTKLFGTVEVTDPIVLARFEAAWEQKVQVTWTTLARGDSGVEVSQVLKGGGTRTFWFQPGLMWYEGQPYTGDLVMGVWPEIATYSLTPEAFLTMVGKADKVTLSAGDYPKLAPVTVSADKMAALKGILSGVGVIESAEEEYPSACRPRAPWYELVCLVGGKPYTVWIMGESDQGVLSDLWSSPLVLFKAPGLFDWASKALPIPAYPGTELESLYSVPGAVLLNGTEVDRTIDAPTFRFVVIEMLRALPPGSPGYPGNPPSGKSPYTLDVQREVIPVWDDWFLFDGKMYYYKGFREVVERAQ